MFNIQSEKAGIDRQLGERIRSQRIACGLSEEQLGSKLRVTGEVVQDWERGITRIATAQLFEISNIFGVPTVFFFSEIDRSLLT